MDILSLGLDISSFSPEKQATLDKFIELFGKLDQFNGKIYNPVMGEGLVAFNQSISSTTKLLDELNVKFVQLQNAQTSSSSATKAATKDTSEFSAVEKERNKMLEQAIALEAKRIAATSDEAKELMAQKLMLSETTKELMASAKATADEAGGKTAAIQKSEEYRLEQMRVVESLKILAVEQDKQEKQLRVDATKAKRDAEKELKIEEQQRTAALKAEVQMEQQSEKAKRDDAKAALALISDLKLLKAALADQSTNYSNLYINKGKDAPETKTALNELRATASIVGDIESQISSATGKTKLFGGALSSAFSQLRMLAYILPGLGIAGIFNLAFEAIGKVVDEMDIFGDKLTKQLALSKEVNETLQSELGLRKSVYEQARKFQEETNAYSTLNEKRGVEAFKGKGYAADVTDKLDIKVATDELNDAKSKILPGDEKLVGKKIEEQIALLRIIQRLQTQLADPDFDKKKLAAGLEEVKKSFNLVDPSALSFKIIRSFGKSYTDLTKEQIERLKTELDLYAQTSSEKISNIQNVNEKETALAKLQNEEAKKRADERRKYTVETTKDNLLNIIDANNKILSNDKSTQEERLKALEKIKNANLEINAINKYNVTANKSSSQSEIGIAKNKEVKDNAKEIREANEKEERVNVEFYQRRIKSVSDTEKALIQEVALANEKIANNEEKTAEERLAALITYYHAKQSMQHLEEQRDLQRGASKFGGKTNLTPEEAQQIKTDSAEKQSAITADAQSKVYNIFRDFALKQLNDVETINELSRKNNKEEYTRALEELNSSLIERRITYEGYKKARKFIDEKYAKEQLDQAILDDKRDIARLKKAEGEKLQVEIDAAKVGLDGAKAGGKKEDIDIAQGKYDGLVKAKEKYDKDIKNADDRLQNDLLKRAQVGIDKDLEKQKAWADAYKAIVEALFDFVQTAVDASFEHRLEKAEQMKQLVDEQYGYEIDAIQKSSLSAKDRAALDIQLNAQKQQFDKNAQVEEKKIRRDQAAFDREITVARIDGTEEAVISALKIPPPLGEILAGERAALGAIAIATVMAAPLPSYATGTKEDGHEGYLARFGEAGRELVKEPNKSAYYVEQDTVGVLPYGTHVVPMYESKYFETKNYATYIPKETNTVSIKETSYFEDKPSDGWEQTRWLAKQLNKKKQAPIQNNFSPKIVVDLGFEFYKQNILGN